MQEYWLGHNLVGFDGAVLEVFGSTDVRRYHIYHINEFKLSRARSGSISLTIIAQGGRGVPMLGDLDEAGLSGAEALITAVNTARRARGWPEVPRSG